MPDQLFREKSKRREYQKGIQDSLTGRSHGNSRSNTELLGATHNVQPIISRQQTYGTITQPLKAQGPFFGEPGEAILFRKSTASCGAHLPWNCS